MIKKVPIALNKLPCNKETFLFEIVKGSHSTRENFLFEMVKGSDSTRETFLKWLKDPIALEKLFLKS